MNDIGYNDSKNLKQYFYSQQEKFDTRYQVVTTVVIPWEIICLLLRHQPCCLQAHVLSISNFAPLCLDLYKYQSHLAYAQVLRLKGWPDFKLNTKLKIYDIIKGGEISPLANQSSNLCQAGSYEQFLARLFQKAISHITTKVIQCCFLSFYGMNSYMKFVICRQILLRLVASSQKFPVSLWKHFYHVDIVDSLIDDFFLHQAKSLMLQV